MKKCMTCHLNCPFLYLMHTMPLLIFGGLIVFTSSCMGVLPDYMYTTYM